MSNKRAGQLAKAQGGFRNRKRELGFKRIQAWVPEATFVQLKTLCTNLGCTQPKLIETVICAAAAGKLEIKGGGAL